MLVVWKTGVCGGLVASSPRTRCRSASSQTPFLFFVFVSTDLKVRGYWPSASRLSDATFASFHFLVHVLWDYRPSASRPFQTPCLLLRCIVMLNLFQHLTASSSCPSPLTDPETSYSPSLIENIFYFLE